MRLLHRSSVFGGRVGNAGGVGNGKKALRRFGSSPRAPPRLTMSRSDSINKQKRGAGGASGNKKGGVNKPGSKRARLRAGLAAAALPELRLAGRKRGPAAAAAHVGAPFCAGPTTARAAAGSDEPASSAGGGPVRTGGAKLLALVLLVLALACVLVQGKAPAVCGCTSADRRRHGAVLCCGEEQLWQMDNEAHNDHGVETCE